MSGYAPRRAARRARAADTDLSTQERQPWRAALRSMVQTALPLFLALPVILPIIQTWVDEHRGGVLPESAAVLATAGIATLTAVTALVTRLMAVPAVNQWLRRWIPALAPDDKPPAG